MSLKSASIRIPNMSVSAWPHRPRDSLPSDAALPVARTWSGATILTSCHAFPVIGNGDESLIVRNDADERRRSGSGDCTRGRGVGAQHLVILSGRLARIVGTVGPLSAVAYRSMVRE